jgi:hypothetical protein
MGALPWTIRSLGVKGDKIGTATAPHLEIPEPPVSESSPLPRRNSSAAHDSNKRSGSLDEKIIAKESVPETKDTNDETDSVASDKDKETSEDSVLDDDKKDVFVDAADQ